ncbi:MAG TPA: hypothetical protein VE961_04390 [Pyrinomonadaceae bacterium]|nr:hypothetical protein [Pyrinomonadaceae bacterium]
MTTLILILALTSPFMTPRMSVHPALPQTPDAVELIRQHYANINQNVGRYRRVKKDLSGFSTEGGEMIAYFHGPTVMKIVATFLGETGKAIEEYYFWNGQIIFVLSTENRYDKPFGKVVRKIENRLYFKEDRLIRWIDENGKEIRSDSADYATKQSDYLKTSKQLSDGARSAQATIEDKH